MEKLPGQNLAKQLRQAWQRTSMVRTLATSTPFEQKDALNHVVKMLDALGARSDGKAFTAQGYMFACQEISPEHVREAALRFIRGEVDGNNKAFAPSTAEFASEARRLGSSPGQKARERIEETRKLTSQYEELPPRTDEEKARVDKLVADFKNEKEKEDAKWARWKEQGEVLEAELIERAKQNNGQVSNDGTGVAMMESLENLRVARIARQQVEYLNKADEKARQKEEAGQEAT